MKRLILAVLLMCGAVVQAQDETPEPYTDMGNPVVWVHAATTQDVYVACFWAKQFPRFASSEKHLLIACRKATWQNANPAKRNTILTAVRRFLAGDDPVNPAKMQAVKTALADANVGFALTDNPLEQLAAWGLKLPAGTGAQ